LGANHGITDWKIAPQEGERLDDHNKRFFKNLLPANYAHALPTRNFITIPRSIKGGRPIEDCVAVCAGKNGIWAAKKIKSLSYRLTDLKSIKEVFNVGTQPTVAFRSFFQNP